MYFFLSFFKNIFKQHFKITARFLFVIILIFFSTTHSKTLERYNKAKNISDYFSGVILLNQNQYQESQKYLKKLDGLEVTHSNYTLKYLYSLINSGNFNQAFNYSKKLGKISMDNYESNLIMGVYYLKNSKLDISKKYFLNAKKNSRSLLDAYISDSLYFWTDAGNLKLEKAEQNFKKLDTRFNNFQKIQNTFLNCFFNSDKTIKYYEDLITNQKTDFSRYNYFYAQYLNDNNKKETSIKVIHEALQKNPRNLLLNQFKLDLDSNTISNFDCENQAHIIAEIFYISANALSSQSLYSLSNFYLNLAKHLNPNFHSYNTLLAENFFKTNNFKKAKKIYKNLSKNGTAFNWYSTKQLARILNQEQDKDEALKLLNNSYNNLQNKKIYEIFDYAEFLKNNEKFKESIPLYSKILNQIEKEHPLYTEATDGRGISYERIGEWKKAEKDLLASLEANPNQAYVINYLAYSWIEQGVKIKKSLNMLERANKLRSNDPFITDSLGWALFKLERYKEAKNYLQLAVKLLPADPIVNDHYGDVLWKNGNKIQARYYWNYVLKLESTEDNLKKTIEKKLIQGL